MFSFILILRKNAKFFPRRQRRHRRHRRTIQLTRDIALCNFLFIDRESLNREAIDLLVCGSFASFSITVAKYIFNESTVGKWVGK